MKYVVTVNGQRLEVTLEGPVARVGDVETEAHLLEAEGTPIRAVTVGGRVHRVLARHGKTAGQYTIDVDGYRFEVEALDERTHAIRQLAGPAGRPAGPSVLSAPMPGLVVRVLVQAGDQVHAGQGLVVIEAMKMENELRSAAAGIVRAVLVRAGSAVEKGAVLVELEGGR